jgi:hypothetical protein
MDQTEAQLRGEIRELRMGVRRLRSLVKSAILLVGAGAVILFPGLLIAVLSLGAFLIIWIYRFSIASDIF